MPMIDALIPENALTPEAERRLLKELTDILIRAEGYDPSNQNAQRVSVLHLHRPAAVFVGGEPSKLPRYRIIPSAPEGQYTDESRAWLVKEITEAVARAENTPFRDIAPRVWGLPDRDSRRRLGRQWRHQQVARHSCDARWWAGAACWSGAARAEAARTSTHYAGSCSRRRPH